MNRTVLGVMLATLVVSGCVDQGSTPLGAARDQADELVEMCVAQVGAPGAYQWKMPGERLDRLTVVALRKFGGTTEGRDMINACIRQNSVLFEQPQTTPTQPAQVQEVPTEKMAAEPAPIALPQVAVPVSRPGCPAGATGLYRGNLIC